MSKLRAYDHSFQDEWTKLTSDEGFTMNDSDIKLVRFLFIIN